VALSQAGLHQGERAGGHGAAVHPAQHAGALQQCEVPAHGLRRDAELLGDVGDGEPAALGDEGGDGVLPFLRVHASPPASL